MRYVGIQTQISRNNRLSVILLLMFPAIILGVVWAFIAIVSYVNNGERDAYGEFVSTVDYAQVNAMFLEVLPWVVGVVGVWFFIAYQNHSYIINNTVHSRPLERRDNPRVYNIMENLCMVCGMNMPHLHIVDDPQLNAFASGINEKTYAVTLTTGIIETLNDEELAGVIGHELTHIRNRDTRLLITSIVFVGIISTAMAVLMRSMYYTVWLGGGSSRKKDKEGGASVILLMLIGLVCCAVAYLFTLLTRFAISRKREYMADAGGAELCGNPLALASALKKISGNVGLNNVKRADVAQLFIAQPLFGDKGLLSFMDDLFSTHPDINKRIEILEQY